MLEALRCLLDVNLHFTFRPVLLETSLHQRTTFEPYTNTKPDGAQTFNPRYHIQLQTLVWSAPTKQHGEQHLHTAGDAFLEPIRSRRDVRRRTERLHQVLQPPLVRTTNALPPGQPPKQLPGKTPARRLGDAQRALPLVRRRRANPTRLDSPALRQLIHN